MIKMRKLEEIEADLKRWDFNKILVKKFKAELVELADSSKSKKVKNPLDLDGDGDVDADDRSIAGKVLASGRRRKSKKNKK